MNASNSNSQQPQTLTKVLLPVFLIVMTGIIGFGIMVPLLPGGSAGEGTASGEQPSAFRAVVMCFADPRTGGLFWLLTVFYFAFSLFVSGFALFLAARVTVHGAAVDPEAIGVLFAYAGLINLVIQALLIDRIVAWFSERTLLIAACALMAAGCAALPLGRTVPLTLAFLTLNNVGGAILRPLLTSQIPGELDGSSRGLSWESTNPRRQRLRSLRLSRPVL